MKLKSLMPLALAGSLALSPGAMSGESRGIRNNNPGNIKKSSIQWQGATGNDGVFVKFATPEDGIRAIARIFKVYHDKYNLQTPAQLMNRWAPASENPTQNYVNFIAKRLGKKPDEKIDFNNKQEVKKLVSAIIEFENGKVPYDDATIQRGIDKS